VVSFFKVHVISLYLIAHYSTFSCKNVFSICFILLVF